MYTTNIPFILYMLQCISYIWIQYTCVCMYDACADHWSDAEIGKKTGLAIELMRDRVKKKDLAGNMWMNYCNLVQRKSPPVEKKKIQTGLRSAIPFLESPPLTIQNATIIESVSGSSVYVGIKENYFGLIIVNRRIWAWLYILYCMSYNCKPTIAEKDPNDTDKLSAPSIFWFKTSGPKVDLCMVYDPSWRTILWALLTALSPSLAISAMMVLWQSSWHWLSLLSW